MADSPHNLISTDKLSAILGAVKALPAVQPQGLTKAEAIKSMRAELDDALANRGYTHCQLAEVLTAQGIKITGATLREYLREKPTVTYRGLVGLIDKHRLINSDAVTVADVKKVLPKLAGLSAKRIAEALATASYNVTAAQVAALIKVGN